LKETLAELELRRGRGFGRRDRPEDVAADYDPCTEERREEKQSEEKRREEKK